MSARDRARREVRDRFRDLYVALADIAIDATDGTEERRDERAWNIVVALSAARCAEYEVECVIDDATDLERPEPGH